MKDLIFREYDIRGVIDEELNRADCYKLGRAIATFLTQKYPEINSIVLGRDGRVHSPEIRNHLCNAFLDSGINVIDLGVIPTPLMYFAVKTLHLQTGLIVTASHNPGHYNGIKIYGAWGGQIQKIKQIYRSEDFTLSNNTGSLSFFYVIPAYVNFMVNHFPRLRNVNLTTVIDCGNGTAGTVIPLLIEKMAWHNIKLLYPEVDGTFPNHEADPTEERNMQDVIRAIAHDPSLTLGIGFDGDCDRMSPVTCQGRLIPGDILLALYARHILEKNPGAGIVFDIKSSSSLENLIHQWGGNPIVSPSGHSIIKNNLMQNKALLAGELSCHFFFNDRYFGYDDGIYAALRLLELLQETGKTLDELLIDIPVTIISPEIRIACGSEENKQRIVGAVRERFLTRSDARVITIDGVKAHMPYGWGLLRASNTQTVISLRFESSTQQGLSKVKNDFYEALEPYFDSKQLKDAIT